MEVRPASEILATLDGNGCLAALPFMPEMVKYCGRRFRVFKSAHKTCDPTGCTNLRRMEDAVHLETRCDGSSHDGCEARCLLIWKTAWLKPVDGPASERIVPEFCDLGPLRKTTRAVTKDGSIRYRCQVTELVPATTNLPSRQPGHYLEDLASGNIKPKTFIRVIVGGVFRLGFSKLTKPFSGFFKRLIKRGQAVVTPAKDNRDSVNLQPGEMVRVRTAEEILATLDGNSKNRGLSFEREMLMYCGGTYKVLYRLNKIISEKTGKMLHLKNDAIVLEGIVCGGLGNRSRLFCQRAPYFYWREAWLQRLGDDLHKTGTCAPEEPELAVSAP